MASIVVFLGLVLFMFQAGYQWRKWEQNESGTRFAEPGDNQAPIDSMLWKI